MLSLKKFLEIYENLGPDANTILTVYFKNYIDDINAAKTPVLKTALVTGYILRCTEEKCLEEKLIKKSNFAGFDKKVSKVLKSGLTREQTIIKLTEYFDDHKKIGLGELIRPYTLLPYKDMVGTFNFWIEDHIKATYKNEIKEAINYDKYYEIIFRCAALGYYFRTAETCWTVYQYLSK